MDNTCTIYFGNEKIKDTYYMQSPYPIFIKAKSQGWICAGVAFRYPHH